jgi:antitoxin (DNA-binding transcriptional repressor) of toxin-antitoxin stability system
MTRIIPVFVNGARVEVADGATALDAIRARDAELARAVEQGTRVVADSRGLPIAPDTPVHGGAIFRLVSARERDAATDEGSPS